MAGFPGEIGQAVRELIDEYEARERLEAQLARDADKLECLIQARECQAQGHEDVPPWIENLSGGRATSLRSSACRGVPASAAAAVVEGIRGIGLRPGDPARPG